jgi:hypothetical protein
MINPQAVGQGNYRFQRTFTAGEFCGSGILSLAPGAEKPNKNSGPTAVVSSHCST